MKKRFLSLLLAAVLFIGLLPGVSLTAQAAVTATKPSAGNGSAENPYQIGTAAELLWFAYSVNNRGKTSICAVLTADIDLSSVCSSDVGNWTSIGNSSKTAYAGTFDGNGYTISELYIKHTDTYSQPSGGLFGTIESGGIVKNLNVSGWIYINISYSIQVGVICGYNKGTIMGCSSSGKVQGISTDTRVWVGGICGINSEGGTIQDCYTTNLYGISGSATGDDEYQTIADVGGICGRNALGTIKNCYVASSVTGYATKVANKSVGGICGYNYSGSVIQNCYFLKSFINSAVGGGSGTVTGVVGKTTSEFASGEVTYLLNGSSSDSSVVWRQNLTGNYKTIDYYPVLDDTHAIVGKNSSGYYNKYAVNIAEPTNGTVTTNKTTAAMGDTVTLTVTPGTGYELDTLTVKNNTSGANVTVKNNQFTMPSANVTVTATFKKVAYNVTIYSTNGAVTTNKTTAAMGDTVTLTVTPDEGYELDTLTVTDGSGANVTVTNNQFIMPASNVTATATFKEKAVTIAPQLRINSETNALEVSYDNGTTWKLLGVNVTGEDGAGGVGAGSAAVSENGDLIITLTANAGYTLPETITVKTGDSALTTGYTYDSVTGTVTIPAASIAGDITITAVGTHEHTWGDTGYTWSEDAACTAKRTCTTCSSEETETVTATSETTAATCTTDGSTTYTATFNVDWATEQTNAVTLPAIGHAWGDVSYTWGDDNKTCTATRTCTNANCSATETAEAMVTSETTAATCTTNGQTTYTATFSTEGNWAEVQTESEPVIAAGHSMTHTAMNAATCIEAGNIEYYYCEACKKYFNDKDGAEEITDTNSLTLAATGHSYGSDYLCTVCGHEKEPAQDSETGEYQISDVREFIWFANLVNGKLDDVEQDTDADFQLTANIDMSGQSWTPIGTKANPYTGSFDGGGYTISNLRSTSSSSGGYTGLFGYVGEGGTVQNVKLKSVSISSSGKTGYAGVICGYNNGGTIANCTVTGTLSTSGQSGSSGGICGYNAGTITGCTSSVKVTASGKSAYAGGICGYNAKAGTISNCTSSGAVTTSGKSGKAGGICGYNAGKIASCSSTGKIRATGQSGKSGKIYGYNSGKVS